MVRRGVLAAFLAAGIFAGSVTTAQAAPMKPDFPLITVGCPDGEGGFEMLHVRPHGAVAFVYDDAGVATGEKLFLRSIDAALFSDSGQLLWENNKTYGQRTGPGGRDDSQPRVSRLGRCDRAAFTVCAGGGDH